MSSLILYITAEGSSQIQRRTDQQTAWLTQFEVPEPLDAIRQNTSLRLKHRPKDAELRKTSVVKESLTTELANSSGATVTQALTVRKASDHFRGVTKLLANDEGSAVFRPEKLGAAEDPKELERRVISDEKKLAERAQTLPPREGKKR